jgi:glycosyltransferase involved in cell wall biosynthesis
MKLVQDADVLVMPSVQEGLPVAVLEAMALWKPTIVSAVGGLEELIHDGENGLLVPPTNAVALAAAIERVIRNPDERAGLGAAAASWVRTHYTSDTVAAQWAVLYRSLLRE